MKRRDFLKAPALAAVPVVGMASANGALKEHRHQSEFPQSVEELRIWIELQFDRVIHTSRAFIDLPGGERAVPVTLVNGQIKEQGEPIKKFSQDDGEVLRSAWEGFLDFKQNRGLEGTLFWRKAPELREYYTYEKRDLRTNEIVDRGPWGKWIYMRLWAC